MTNKTSPCFWVSIGEDCWDTTCGNLFQLSTDETPTDHSMQYCCYCGQPLVSITEAKVLPVGTVIDSAVLNLLRIKATRS